MTVTLTLHFHLLWALTLAAVIWLPICTWIGNLIQREWWFSVLVVSVALVGFLFVVAVIQMIVCAI